MKTSNPITQAAIVVLGVAAMTMATREGAQAGARDDAMAAVPDTGIYVQVSPATIVLNRPVVWVTVHTDIPFSSVIPGSVQLNGVSPDVVTADNRGQLVAKFDYEIIALTVVPPQANLTLSGVTDDWQVFAGTDTVAVR